MPFTDTLPQEVPAASIDDLIAIEFPRVASRDRERLAEFTRATRAIARDHGGNVTGRALAAAGFGPSEQDRLMPQAERLLSLLDRSAVASSAA